MIKVFVVGYGRIAERHVQVIRANSSFTLVGVSEIDNEKIAKAGPLDVPVYESFTEGISNSNPDLVVVCSESGRHVEHGIAAMELCSTVLLEKPMALTLEGAERLLEESRRTGARLNIVQQNRLNLPIQALKRAIDSNQLGDIYSGTLRVLWHRDESYYAQDSWRGTWKYDGGVLSNQANHHIDFLSYLFGRPDFVSGRSRNTRGLIQSEDLSVGIIGFDSGPILSHHITTAARPENLEASLTIVAEAGVIEIGGIAANEVLRWTSKNSEANDLVEKIDGVYGNGHVRLYDHISDNWSSLPTEITSPDSALVTVETVQRLYQSAQIHGDFNHNLEQFLQFGASEKP